MPAPFSSTLGDTRENGAHAMPFQQNQRLNLLPPAHNLTRGQNRLWLSLLLVAFIGSVWAVPVAASEPIQALLQGNETTVGGVRLHAPTATRRFYEQRQYQAAWRESDRGSELMKAIAASELQGLKPQNYHQALLSSASLNDVAVKDILATDAWLSLAANVLGGQLDPVSMEPDWTAARRERDLPALLAQAIESGRIAETIVDLEPNAQQYAQLKRELSRLLAAPLIRFDAFPAGATLKPGQTDARLPQLCEALKRHQESCAETPERYEGELVEAIKRIQAKAGLQADGVIGPATVKQLNMSAEQRIRQLRVNMERWRWLPEDLGQRHVRVNIADFSLKAVNKGVVEREHAVIIGRNYRQTPIFSDRIRYMVFNPWWETPQSIARKDKLPEFKANPKKVIEQGFELRDMDGNILSPESVDWRSYSTQRLPIRLRQKPGPNNALGKVKIMYPNAHSVYLHDTPGKALFDKTERAFSSGCVRVKDAMELSAWLLQGNSQADLKVLEQSKADYTERRVNLSQPVPVHMLYFTTVVGDKGEVRYLNDIYQRDQRIADGLGIPAI